MATRDYPAEGITVHWDSEVCAHSGICSATLPEVFRYRERPWVVPDAAGPEEIAAAIDACPSGALRYTLTTPEPLADPDPRRAVVTVHANGPLEVQGEMVVTGADGSVVRESRRQYFCRCGQSAAKPFCDGTHRKVGFTDPGLGPQRP